jgi:hypothetical protein
MCLTVNCSLYVWQYDYDGSQKHSNSEKSNLENVETSNFFNLRTVLSQIQCQFIFQSK